MKISEKEAEYDLTSEELSLARILLSDSDAKKMRSIIEGRGFSQVARMDPPELRAQSGISGKGAMVWCASVSLGRLALRPRPLGKKLENSVSVYAYMRPVLAHLAKEVFHALLLDSQHNLISDRRSCEGGLASCSIAPREAFVPALSEGAAAVIFVHNHPSGDPRPSPDDIKLTERLVAAGDVIGVHVLDHVVVADRGYVSLADLGYV